MKNRLIARDLNLKREISNYNARARHTTRDDLDLSGILDLDLKPDPYCFSQGYFICLSCIIRIVNCGTVIMKLFTAFSVSVGALNVLIVKPHTLIIFLLPLLLLSFSYIWSDKWGFDVLLIPTLGVSHLERDALIEQYFDFRLNYVEIISFLLSTHAISISLKQL